MHERIARRRNALLARRIAAVDDEIATRLDAIERLCLRLGGVSATDPLMRDMLTFCRVSRLSMARSSPFSENGRRVRSMVAQGCRRIGAVMDEAVAVLRATG